MTYFVLSWALNLNSVNQGHLFMVTLHGQHRSDTVAYTQTDSPQGSTGLGAESVYDYLVHRAYTWFHATDVKLLKFM